MEGRENEVLKNKMRADTITRRKRDRWIEGKCIDWYKNLEKMGILLGI